jgi:hypothetical protein
MTFESKIMTVVEDVLGTNEMDGFFNGTLYVTCFPDEAKSLLTTLNKKFGEVQVTPQRGHMEYAFDFVG